MTQPFFWSTVFPTNWQISQTIPPELIGRVEILRGPASALYGANASGGVVNILLKEGSDEPGGSLGAGGGSFGRFRAAAAADGRVDKFRYALAATYEEADGANVVQNNLNASVHMIDECDYDKAGAGFNTSYRFSERTRLRLFYNFFNNRYTRGRPHVGGDWDYHLAGVIYDQKIGDRIDLQASGALRVDDYLHLYDKNGTNYDPRQKRYMDLDETPLELQATADIGGGHMLTVGVFYNNQETEQEYDDWITGALTQENRYSVRTLAGYLQDVWRPTSSLTVTAGLRYDQWENYDNYFSNYVNPNPGDRTDESYSPKVGVRYNFADTHIPVGELRHGGSNRPRRNSSTTTVPPAATPAFPNPNLKPETTNSYEIGVERWFAGRLAGQPGGILQ